MGLSVSQSLLTLTYPKLEEDPLKDPQTPIPPGEADFLRSPPVFLCALLCVFFLNLIKKLSSPADSVCGVWDLFFCYLLHNIFPAFNSLGGRVLDSNRKKRKKKQKTNKKTQKTPQGRRESLAPSGGHLHTLQSARCWVATGLPRGPNL